MGWGKSSFTPLKMDYRKDSSHAEEVGGTTGFEVALTQYI